MDIKDLGFYPLRIYSVNPIKSTVCGFDHITEEILDGEPHLLCSVYKCLKLIHNKLCI